MPERLMMEDAALAEEARNGNAAAFVMLAKRWWTPLYRVSWNISGSASCAAQITERTLLAAIHRSLGVGFTVEIADRTLLPEDQTLQIRRGADHRVDFRARSRCGRHLPRRRRR